MIDRYETAGEFTRRKIDELNELFNNESDYDQDYEDAMDYLNEATNFRTFDTGLTEFIKKHGYKEDISLSNEDLIHNKTDFLHKKFNEKNISITKSTLASYFSGERRPDNRNCSRNNIFKICFALDLDIQESIDFFVKIYFDRPFNVKNPEELVYYFCIKNKKSYTDAMLLIEKVNKILDENSSISINLDVHTKNIEEQTDFFTTEEELIRYISDNKNTFNKYNTTAIEEYHSLLNDVQGSKENNKFIKKLKNKITSGKHLTSDEEKQIDKCGLVIREAYYKGYIQKKEDYIPNVSLLSNDFMLFMIYDSKTPVRTNTNYSFKNNANLIKVIRSNFPSIDIMSKIERNPKYSFEALRKILILLDFYKFCFCAQLEGEDFDDYNSFIDEMDDILTSSGMAPLYIGNPYDWLFLYCIKCFEIGERPLDVFRDIISDIYPLD